MFAHAPHVRAAYRQGMTQMRAIGTAAPWKPAIRPDHGVSGHALSNERRRTLLARLKDALASAGVRRPRVLRGARTEVPFDAPLIRTDRLTLRAYRPDDVDDWYALQSEPSVTEFLPWPERDRRSSARHLRDRTRHTRLWQADDFLALAIEHDGRVIGDISLHLRSVSAATRSVEIGWVMHPQFGGAGYATEAASRVLRFAFDVVGAQRVTAVTDARNLRSVALAKRLGFRELQAARRGAPESVFLLEA